MVERVVWDHEAAGSKPVTRTRKPAEIIRFQRVSYVNCSIFEKTLFFDYRGAEFALRIRQTGSYRFLCVLYLTDSTMLTDAVMTFANTVLHQIMI